MGAQKPVYTAKRAAARRKKKITVAIPAPTAALAHTGRLILQGQSGVTKDTATDNVNGTYTRPKRGQSVKFKAAIAVLQGDADSDEDPESKAGVKAGNAGLEEEPECEGGTEASNTQDPYAEIKRLRQLALGVKKGVISPTTANAQVEASKKNAGAEPRPRTEGLALGYLEIPADIMNFYDNLMEVDTIHMQLPMIVRPERHAQGYIIEATQPWTCESLFKLYLYAYSLKDWNICDLVTDTWIRAFQTRDANPRLKIWKENRSEFKKDAKNVHYNDNDDGALWLAPDADSFNFKLLKELYDHTKPDCGVRRMWTDALALCGNWLERRMDWKGPGMELWHPQLMWDVLHTALRLVRVRLTLKIEEGNPAAWCDRYHEHSKHGLKCYRELAKELLGGEAVSVETDVEMSG